MFTGIIEGIGRVEEIVEEGSNVHLWLSCPFTHELKVDQSLAHNGVCLTVVEITEDRYRVTAIDETLGRTNLGDLQTGGYVNLERCMPAHGRFDGHIVQGHVDQRAEVSRIEEKDGSWNYFLTFERPDESLVVSKGSIAINGVSLTVVEASTDHCSVSIIPFTHEHTTFQHLTQGDHVNVEFDILGKYVMEAQRRLVQDSK
ncbi:MAG: riboflavin synthase [Flavobacteriales bacterium]|nr:riboflavin synthase [Flavobacteriales bacterium]